jgi:hypothetical protein
MAGDAAGAAADVAPDARNQVLQEYARLPRGAATSEIVAYARIGEHRVVKARLTGHGATAVVQQRWARDAEAWRLVAAELLAVEQVG